MPCTDLRLSKIEQVVEVRRDIVRAGRGGGERRSSKLLDSSALLEISKAHISKVVVSREKRKNFDAAQAAMFAARQQGIVDAADRKAFKAAAYKKQMQRDFEQWKQVGPTFPPKLDAFLRASPGFANARLPSHHLGPHAGAA